MQKNKSLQFLIGDFGLPYIFQMHSFQLIQIVTPLPWAHKQSWIMKKKRLKKVSQDISTLPHLNTQEHESEHSHMDFY